MRRASFKSSVPGFRAIDEESDIRAVLLHVVALARTGRSLPRPAQLVAGDAPRPAYGLAHFRAGERAVALQLVREVRAVGEFLVAEESSKRSTFRLVPVFLGAGASGGA